MTSGDKQLYRGCVPVLDHQFKKGEEGQSPAEAVIEAIAEAAGVEPLELPPLYEFIDPEALDNLFQQHDSATDPEAMLVFSINKWNVFVRADGRIRIYDGTQPTDPQPIFEPAEL